MFLCPDDVLKILALSDLLSYMYIRICTHMMHQCLYNLPFPSAFRTRFSSTSQNAASAHHTPQVQAHA